MYWSTSTLGRNSASPQTENWDLLVNVSAVQTLENPHCFGEANFNFIYHLQVVFVSYFSQLKSSCIPRETTFFSSFQLLSSFTALHNKPAGTREVCSWIFWSKVGLIVRCKQSRRRTICAWRKIEIGPHYNDNSNMNGQSSARYGLKFIRSKPLLTELS